MSAGSAWRTLGTAACIAVAGCSVVLGPDASTRADHLFDEVWKEFDKRYAFFELKQVDWNALHAQHRPAETATPAQLLDALRAILGSLDDPHVILNAGGTRFQSGRARVEVATHFSPPVTLSYVTGARNSPSGRMRYGRVSPEIGYLWIPSFTGTGWGSDVDNVIADLPGIASLIIDVRDNGGGNNANAMQIAGRFTQVSRLVAYYRYRSGPRHSDLTDYTEHTIPPRGAFFGGNVVVLTNRLVASASEDFVLMMRAVPGTVVVGDTTMGASGNPIARELPNGWTYQLSEWIEYTPERESFEGVGLAPHVPIQAAAADMTAGRDRVLERAILLLTP